MYLLDELAFEDRIIRGTRTPERTIAATDEPECTIDVNEGFHIEKTVVTSGVCVVAIYTQNGTRCREMLESEELHRGKRHNRSLR